MPQSKRYENRVAIITGAAGGIGLATAKLLSSEGARIVLVDRDEEKLKAAESEIKKAGALEILTLICDVTKEEDVKGVVETSIRRLSKIDLIVNNAGRMIFKSIEEHTSKDWWDILSVDLLGAFLFTKYGFLTMEKGSAIVNVASIHAIETTPNVCSYAAAKAALLSLTRSSALEGKPKGIRVNAVLPGAIDTPMLWNNPNIKAGLETIKLDDVGKPEDIASVIAFLGSEDSEFVQGTALRADGGRLANL